jgi:hypothetical protein
MIFLKVEINLEDEFLVLNHLENLWISTFMHFKIDELMSFKIIFNELIESCIRMEHWDSARTIPSMLSHNDVKWQEISVIHASERKTS